MSNQSIEKVPFISETIQSFKLIRLIPEVGVQISKGDSLLEIDCDYAEMEVPAMFDGILVKYLVSVGDVVKPGDDLCIIDTSA